jgi:hypothetical protein
VQPSGARRGDEMTKGELHDLYDPLQVPVGTTLGEQLGELLFMVTVGSLAVTVVWLYVWVTK